MKNHRDNLMQLRECQSEKPRPNQIFLENSNLVNDIASQATQRAPDFTDDYQIKGLIRKGRIGEVRYCSHKQTDQIRAVKIFER